MTDIRLGFTTKATCHYTFGQSKGACSPVSDGGVNALRYGSTLRHLKTGWKWKKLEVLFEMGQGGCKRLFLLHHWQWHITGFRVTVYELVSGVFLKQECTRCSSAC